MHVTNLAGGADVDELRDVEGRDKLKDEGDPPRQLEENEHRDAESDSLYLDNRFSDEVITSMIEYKSRVFELASKNIRIQL